MTRYDIRYSARLTDQRGSYAFSCGPFYYPCPSSSDIKHNFCDFKQQQWFTYSMYSIYFIDLSEQQMWELWIQLKVLLFVWSFRLQGTPTDNRIKLTSPETGIPGLYFSRWQYMRSSANFRTVLSENQNTKTHDMPIPRQTLTQNSHSRSLTVVCFDVSEKSIKESLNFCGGLQHTCVQCDGLHGRSRSIQG